MYINIKDFLTNCIWLEEKEDVLDLFRNCTKQIGEEIEVDFNIFFKDLFQYYTNIAEELLVKTKEGDYTLCYTNIKIKIENNKVKNKKELIKEYKYIKEFLNKIEITLNF